MTNPPDDALPPPNGDDDELPPMPPEVTDGTHPSRNPRRRAYWLGELSGGHDPEEEGGTVDDTKLHAVKLAVSGIMPSVIQEVNDIIKDSDKQKPPIEKLNRLTDVLADNQDFLMDFMAGTQGRPEYVVHGMDMLLRMCWHYPTRQEIAEEKAAEFARTDEALDLQHKAFFAPATWLYAFKHLERRIRERLADKERFPEEVAPNHPARYFLKHGYSHYFYQHAEEQLGDRWYTLMEVALGNAIADGSLDLIKPGSPDPKNADFRSIIERGVAVRMDEELAQMTSRSTADVFQVENEHQAVDREKGAPPVARKVVHAVTYAELFGHLRNKLREHVKKDATDRDARELLDYANLIFKDAGRRREVE